MTGALRAALAEIARKPHRYLFFDFDGTLSPITDRPQDAAAHPDILAPLESLCRQPRTTLTVVSGRPVSDIRERLPLPGLVVAGVHGLVIDGPSFHQTHSDAARVEPLIQRAADRLGREIGALEGIVIENKGITVAVHYRRAGSSDAEHARSAARDVVRSFPGIRALEGKKVVELRPDIDWDKGRAVSFILERLSGSTWESRGGVLYMGDDRTDEDAFRVLDGKAVTVKVGELGSTAARYRVRDPDEVVGLVRELLSLIERTRSGLGQNRNPSS